MSWTPERCDGCALEEATYHLVLHSFGTLFAFCGMACLLRWMRACGYGIDDEVGP